MQQRTLYDTQTVQAEAVAVAGPDIDQSLLRSLEVGDKVMAEVNGSRLYSQLTCPLGAEKPWTVERNTVPAEGERPNNNHRLVISHPSISHFVTLHYQNLLYLPRRQPAVFLEHDIQLSSETDGRVNPVYFILQFVSHYMPFDEVDNVFTPYDRCGARLVLGEDETRMFVLEQWAAMFRGFKKPGWGQKSVYRLAQRAFVKPSIIEAFQQERFELVDSASLYRLHEALHWLPYQIQSSPYAVQRDVLEA